MLKIAIYVKEEAYGKALTKGLGRRFMPFRFDILSPYIEETLLNEKLKKADLVLTDFKVEGKNVIYMTENQIEENLDKDQDLVLFKYKKMEALVKNIVLIYFDLTGITIRVVGNKESKVIGFSNINVDKSTEISLKCKMSICDDNKILYMSLRNINTALLYYQLDYPSKVMMLLYYMKNYKEFPIENYISNVEAGLDILGDNMYFNGLSQCSVEEIDLLIDKVKALEKYDYIFIDLGYNFLDVLERKGHLLDGLVFFLTEDAKSSSIVKNIEQIANDTLKKENVLLYSFNDTYRDETLQSEGEEEITKFLEKILLLGNNKNGECDTYE